MDTKKNKEENQSKAASEGNSIPVRTRHRFDVYTTSITLKRRRLDVKTTLCAYWDTIWQHHRLLLACTPSHFLNMIKQHITIIIYIPFSSITMDHKEVSHTPQ